AFSRLLHGHVGPRISRKTNKSGRARQQCKSQAHTRISADEPQPDRYGGIIPPRQKRIYQPLPLGLLGRRWLSGRRFIDRSVFVVADELKGGHHVARTLDLLLIFAREGPVHAVLAASFALFAERK